MAFKKQFDFCTKMNHLERRQDLGGWIWSDFWKWNRNYLSCQLSKELHNWSASFKLIKSRRQTAASCRDVGKTSSDPQPLNRIKIENLYVKKKKSTTVAKGQCILTWLLIAFGRRLEQPWQHPAKLASWSVHIPDSDLLWTLSQMDTWDESTGI